MTDNNMIDINIPEAMDSMDSMTLSVHRLQNAAERLPAYIKSTDSFWKGKAADEFRNNSLNCIKRLKNVLERIDYRAGQMNNTLQEFRTLEASIKGTDELSGDVLK